LSARCPSVPDSFDEWDGDDGIEFCEEDDDLLCENIPCIRALAGDILEGEDGGTGVPSEES